MVKFTVVEDQAETLVGILQGAKPILLSAPGCEAVEVLHSTDDPSRVVLSEIWQSREIHDRYAAATDTGSSKLAPLLRREPEVEIFDIK